MIACVSVMERELMVAPANTWWCAVNGIAELDGFTSAYFHRTHNVLHVDTT